MSSQSQPRLNEFRFCLLAASYFFLQGAVYFVQLEDLCLKLVDENFTVFLE